MSSFKYRNELAAWIELLNKSDFDSHAGNVNAHHDKVHSFLGGDHSGIPVPAPVGDFLRDDGTWQSVNVVPAGGVSTPYLFSSVLSNPPTGYVSVNNANQTLATECQINKINQNANDISPFIANLQLGDILGYSDTTTPGAGNYYTVVGPPVDNGTWWAVPVTHTTGEGGMVQDDTISLAIIGNPENSLPVGGEVGQVLTKYQTANFATDWQYVAASNVTYDNTVSQIAADNVQDAVDAVYDAIPDANIYVDIVSAQTVTGEKTWAADGIFLSEVLVGASQGTILPDERVYAVGNINVAAGFGYHVNGVKMVSFPEAPEDGNAYVRADSAWELGSRMYISATEPVGAPNGSLWVDTAE